MKRKAISGSLRWSIFARDGFRCRYCGAQAGEVGVTLHIDHVVSVANGGTNAVDNLVTACQKCNGGKSARSLDQLPGSADAAAFAHAQAVSLKQQAGAIAESIEAHEELRQEVINLVCDVFGVKTFKMSDQNVSQLVILVKRHGGELVREWLHSSFVHGVNTKNCVRYVHGIIRNLRERGEVA